nr:hypothetical protein [uncultured Pseudomonas sp.]
MKNIDGWAPYLYDPLTLVAFIVAVGGAVLLGVLKWTGVDKKIILAATVLYGLGFVSALILALSKGLNSPNPTPAPVSTPVKTQPQAVQPEAPPSINIQIARGSHNVITNGSEKSK